MLMKLSVSKELSEDEDVDELLNILNPKKSDEVFISLFDTSLGNKFAEKGVINVGFEDRLNVKSLAIQEAINNQCNAFLFIPKNCVPIQGMVNALVEPMDKDDNVSVTYSDFCVDGVVMIQSMPICFCRRLEPNIDDLYDISKTKGIIKYIPISLYNVKR